MAKKIIILGTAHPFRGGMAAFNERLANAFIAEGDNVIIYNFKLQYPGFLFPGKTQYSDSPAPKNLNIISLVNSINPLNWIKAGRAIKKEKPDLLIVGYWMPFMAPCFGTILRMVRSNKQTHIVSILHNVIPHETMPGIKTLAKYFLKKVDAFVAMSKSVLNDLDLLKIQRPKAFCPHPLYDHFGKITEKNIALEKLQLNKEFNYVLFFGLIRDYKGLDLLIEAFALKELRATNIKLIVAGEFYSNEDKYMELIKHHNLEQNIIVHSRYIADEDVSLYFGAADLVAQPYKTATQSGVTQIGYHFEKPMLVTNVGGLAEIIPNEKVGYVVETQANEIAEKIIDFYSNSREKEFHQNILIEKKKYSWSRMTGTINELYSKKS